MIGRKLSHYEIVDEISRGGMGVVYRAVDVSLGREVAFKVLPDELVHDSGRRERLLQEARAASLLEHPHIAVIHEVGEAEGVTFIAMELIRGEKLSEGLSRGPLPQARALTHATEIAEGLARAHEKGIVHRDLKPANVIVTDDGHTKIIDFGLAKLIEPVKPDAATVSVHGSRTEAGLVMGTAAYMSPEQARGSRVDHRSDIFALGVMLFEMVTGRPAFQGQSSLDTMQAVITQPVPPLPAVAGASAEATADLQRIIAKATAKDPEDRFQGMKDLIVDLRAARRRLESAQTGAVVTPPSGQSAVPAASHGHRYPILVGAVLAFAVAGLSAVLWWTGGGSPDATVNPSGKAAIAVLYFENNTGDASLDWMRTGLTNMIVTDLSQSAHIEVLGTDRLVQILQDLERVDDRVVSAEVVQAIADRSGVDNVVLGSYVRSGDAIRISARLQDARTGRIITAERVEGSGEASLFSLVDELTQRFKTKMSELGGGRAGSLLPRPGETPAEAGLDRGLKDITTSSIDAYRHYAEGMHFHERGLSSQAAPLLEKAIEIDPEFAMAYAKLAVVHNNLIAFDKRDYFAKRALDLTDRLTTRERYYIEGFYYSLRPETLERGLEAYQHSLKLHPEHQASRHNLGLQFMFLERYAEGIAQYEELLRRGTSNATSYENLADMLIRTGNVQRAREIADAFVNRYPDSGAGMRLLGMTLTAENRLDDARAAFEKAEALDPLDFGPKLGQRSVAMLQGRWNDAEAIDAELARSPSPFQKLLSLAGGAMRAEAHGRGRDARDFLDRAARVAGLPPQVRAAVHNRMAMALLRQRRFESALAEAQLALVDAREERFETLQLIAIAQAAVGNGGDAEKMIALLESQAKTLPSQMEIRRVHWTRGALALLRNDTATAVAEMRKAVEMLPANGPVLGPPSNHCDLWFAAALAHIKAGRDADAAQLLERIQSGPERIWALDTWGRSFFLLAQIYERRGDAARAREQYARFADLWQDGDLERGWVAEARKKLGR